MQFTLFLPLIKYFHGCAGDREKSFDFLKKIFGWILFCVA